jgi:hypothetical protein
VLSHLRGRIIGGDLRPGDRLPTRNQLEDLYHVSGVTIQRVLDQLVADGFVYARGRNGTFVAHHLPHTTRYGMLFSLPLSRRVEWRRLWSVLHHELPAVEQRRQRQLPVYSGIRDNPGAGDYDRLLEDLHSHRLAGLILTSSLCAIEGTHLAEMSGVPKVVLRSRPTELALPQLLLNRDRWIERALDDMVQQGRRRIAILLHGGLLDEPGNEAMIHRAFEARGLRFYPHLVQCADLEFPRSAANLVQLMVHSSLPERPDALLIADDHLVEHASTGLVAAGLRVPEDIAVIAHCNFPWPTPSVLNVKRLGYDTNHVLDLCIDSIDRQRSGQAVPMKTRIAPIFEDELVAPDGAESWADAPMAPSPTADLGQAQFPPNDSVPSTLAPVLHFRSHS